MAQSIIGDTAAASGKPAPRPVRLLVSREPAEPIAADADIGDHKVHVTFFRDFAAKSYTTDNLTLLDLRERVLNASARKKDNLPWLKLAIFGDERSQKGSLRHDANVERITGIEIDYDIEQVAFADALTALTELQI